MAEASPISVAFGKAIRQERRKKGITQEELAEKCGLDRTYISQIERGLKNPTLPVAWELAINLEINFVTLMAAALQHIPGASH
ncbi:helix-turn-helix domain-containing protein [Spirosoma endbachense]|uniref:Helix-turn-helix domain-containing protein n=1 Tax=Spirosoma endbachense TaxID=2666025 RepID=A0A6P1VU09_9BACT|nr:helix-turn-helix transcriptional regulator [Spirosoma endbachense]QHV95582.1 helix-turn-helix domain-containing protein [Spirosoma endbachense]